MNILLDEQNDNYQLILTKFFDTLETIPIHSKSRKEYCIPYKSLLPWIGEDDLLNEIQSSKNKDEFKQTVVNILIEKSNILSQLLAQQIKSHNIMFVRLLDRFNETVYSSVTKVKRKKVHFEKEEKEEDEYSLKGPDRNTESSVDSKLPLFVDVMFQSSRYKKLEKFKLNVNSTNEAMQNMFNLLFYTYMYGKSEKNTPNKDTSNKDTMKDIENMIACMNITGEDIKESLINIIECVSVIDKYINLGRKDLHIINIYKWDSGISLFCNGDIESNEKDFCKTSLFESMYQSWFPWCKNPEEFLDMLFISKCIKQLNNLWYDSQFTNNSSMYAIVNYENIMLRSRSLYSLFIEDSEKNNDKILGLICIYLKQYYNYTVNIGFFCRWLRLCKHYFCVTNTCMTNTDQRQNNNQSMMQNMMSNNVFIFLTYLSNFCNVHLLSENGTITTIKSLVPSQYCVVFLWDLCSNIEMIGLTLESNDVVMHGNIDFSQQVPLLSTEIPGTYGNEWMIKWNSQYWPSFEDLWSSYIKYNYVLPIIHDKDSSFFVKSVEIEKGNNVKKAYQKAYSILRVWPDVDLKKDSLIELLLSGSITRFRDIIGLLMLEKKMFTLLDGTKTKLWIELIHDGFKSGNNILRCQDVFLTKKGWNFDMFGKIITPNDIEYFGCTPEDVCYMCIRLIDLLSTINITLDIVGCDQNSEMNVNGQFIYTCKATNLTNTNTSTMKMSDLSMSNLFLHPLLSKITNTGQINVEYFIGLLNIQLRSNKENELKEYISLKNTSDDVFVVNKSDIHLYNSDRTSIIEKTKTVIKTHRPLPYPITLNPDCMTRLGFSGEEGEATKRLDNGRYEIIIYLGSRTAKLFPVKDFQWNDIKFMENTQSAELYEKQKEKIVQGAYMDNFSNNAPQYMNNKYYKPTYKDRHIRACYYHLYHPSSKTSIIPFITFLNIHLDLDLQDTFYDFVCNNDIKDICLMEQCVLYRMCHLLWNIYIRRCVPKSLMSLNREITFDNTNFVEKVKHYYPNCEDLKSESTFHLLMNELYRKVKWHCK